MAFQRAAVAMLALASLGCSSAADTSAAETAAARFHDMLDSGDFDEIYQASSEEFKKASTEDNFTALLAAVHRKLGKVRSTSKQAWRTDFNTAGTFVRLVYSTTFAGGEASEQFVFKQHDATFALVGYHIASNALIMK